jgi:hypothetical protein
MQSQNKPAGPFPVYVPRPGSHSLADVLPASAIVGFPLEANHSIIHVFYEGNRYTRKVLVRFADRAVLAAGRCRWFRLDAVDWQREHPGEPLPPSEYGYVSYPTAAQAHVAAGDLIRVAVYDDVLGIVVPLDAEGAAGLRDWIDSTDPIEFLASGVLFRRRREATGQRDGQPPPMLPPIGT